MNNNIHDYIIVGAGMSGVAFARLLQMSGVQNFILLESAAQPGGLCRSQRVGGHVIDTGGGHFLCTKHEEVYRFIFSHLPREEFVRHERVSKVRVRGHEIDYPIESNLWQLPDGLRDDYLGSVAGNGEARGLPPPQTFEAWIRWKLGDRIAEDYMLPYNRKVWGVEPAEMDIDWLHKIPRLDVGEIVEACRRRSADPAKMPSHAYFYYPRHGGFQRVFDALLKPVADRVRCGEAVDSIEPSAGGLVVNGRHVGRRVINTAPWPAITGALPLSARGRAALARLRHSGLAVSLHESAAAASSRAHWIYEPAPELRHHRDFLIGNYAADSAPDGVMRETNLLRHAPDATALATFRNEHAYPVPSLGWAEAIALVLREAAEHGVHGLGRWGQWQYFNSDVCIHEAMKLAERLGHTAWKPSPG